MEFEWHEQKRQETLLRRGIDFLDVISIWEDPKRQERLDLRKNYGEPRLQTIGRSSLGIFFVVYTTREYEQGKPINRVISARVANGKEIQQYQERTFTFGAKP